MISENKLMKMPQNSIAMMQNFPHEMEHDSTFLFTSESVGEGHPGKRFVVSCVNIVVSDNWARRCKHLSLSHIADINSKTTVKIWL